MSKIIIFATFYLIFCSHTESAAISFDGFNKSLVNSFNQTSQVETVVLERSLEDFQNLSASNSTREKRHFFEESERPIEGRSFEGRLFEGRPFEGRPFEGRPFEGRPFEGRPFEGRPFEETDRSFDGRDQNVFQRVKPTNIVNSNLVIGHGGLTSIHENNVFHGKGGLTSINNNNILSGLGSMVSINNNNVA